MNRVWTTLVAVVGILGLCYAAPIPLRLVDMTHVFDNTTIPWPGENVSKFQLKMVFNGTLKNSSWVQSEDYSSSIHVGTHLDSPRHFSQSGLTTDQIPLSKLVAPAAVIDITQKAEENPDYAVTVEDLTEWEAETGQRLDEVILLLRTGWEHRWSNRTAYLGTPDNDVSKFHFPGMSEEAAQWLVDNRNINGFGTDTISLDRGQTGYSFRVHQILLGRNIFGIENVDKISELPLYGATLYVMPMKIGSASGAPARVMATFPEMTLLRNTREIGEL